jgi:hypothetical protein
MCRHPSRCTWSITTVSMPSGCPHSGRTSAPVASPPFATGRVAAEHSERRHPPLPVRRRPPLPPYRPDEHIASIGTELKARTDEGKTWLSRPRRADWSVETRNML